MNRMPGWQVAFNLAQGILGDYDECVGGLLPDGCWRQSHSWGVKGESFEAEL